MAIPTNRTTFKQWVRNQADENANIARGPFAGEAKLEAIIDTVIGDYSAVNPLIMVGTITISGQYAILFDDWVEGPEWNTNILYALQRGIDPTTVDLNQSGYGYDPCCDRSRSGYSGLYESGYGYGTGGSVIQNPVTPATPRQLFPEPSTALIDGVQKKVFILPVANFSTGASFEVRYCGMHIIRDAEGEGEDLIPALMTIPRKDLSVVYDMIFARAVKARIFRAINTNEVEGKDSRDTSTLKDLAGNDGLINKFPR